MKILLIPIDFHKHIVDPKLFTDMLNGFNLYSEAVIYTDLSQAIEFKPDVVFYQGGLDYDLVVKIKNETKAVWTTWTGDVRYAPMKSLLECRRFTDIYFVPFSGDRLKFYEKVLGKPCKYIFEPLHEWKIIKPKELNEGVITFVGNIYDTVPGGESRIELVNFLKSKINLRRHGSSYGQINVDDVPQAYNDSYAVIAENNWWDISGYFTPRNLLAMSNSCCVAKWFNGCENLFKNYEHCIYYKHKYELLDVIDMLNECPEIRNEIAQKGHDFVKDRYTYAQWAKIYLDLI